MIHWFETIMGGLAALCLLLLWHDERRARRRRLRNVGPLDRCRLERLYVIDRREERR